MWKFSHIHLNSSPSTPSLPDLQYTPLPLYPPPPDWPPHLPTLYIYPDLVPSGVLVGDGVWEGLRGGVFVCFGFFSLSFWGGVLLLFFFHSFVCVLANPEFYPVVPCLWAPPPPLPPLLTICPPPSPPPPPPLFFLSCFHFSTSFTVCFLIPITPSTTFPNPYSLPPNFTPPLHPPSPPSYPSPSPHRPELYSVTK